MLKATKDQINIFMEKSCHNINNITINKEIRIRSDVIKSENMT